MRDSGRLAGVAYNTVGKLLRDIGPIAAAYLDKNIRNIPAKRVQCDEMWAFNYTKDARLGEAKAAPEDAGSIWTWVAIDSDTKLLISTMVSCNRGLQDAEEFMQDLRQRVVGRISLTTDGYRGYAEAVTSAFGKNVDYSQLIKYREPDHQGGESTVTQIKRVIVGQPEAKGISTSYVERQNLTMRMSMKRCIRKTNAHSKRIESHRNALALHVLVYNYVREHQTLKQTPAMAAGLAEWPWTMEDVVGLLGDIPK